MLTVARFNLSVWPPSSQFFLPPQILKFKVTEKPLSPQIRGNGCTFDSALKDIRENLWHSIILSLSTMEWGWPTFHLICFKSSAFFCRLKAETQGDTGWMQSKQHNAFQMFQREGLWNGNTCPTGAPQPSGLNGSTCVTWTEHTAGSSELWTVSHRVYAMRTRRWTCEHNPADTFLCIACWMRTGRSGWRFRMTILLVQLHSDKVLQRKWIIWHKYRYAFTPDQQAHSWLHSTVLHHLCHRRWRHWEQTLDSVASWGHQK